MSKRAEFIGMDAINENLASFKFDGIGVFQGKFEKFKRMAVDGESEEDLIEHFNAWADRMLASNPNNAQCYAIQLYDLPEGGKKAQGTTSFTFCFINPEQTKMAIKGTTEEKPTRDGYVSKRELEQALEIQRLEFEKHLLEKELAEEDDEELEEEPVGVVGAIQNTVMDKLPQIMDLVLANLFQNKQPQTNIPMGIGSNVDEIISEFRKINPDIESDLLKLLNLAKTKPDLFKLLITQLRSM